MSLGAQPTELQCPRGFHGALRARRRLWTTVAPSSLLGPALRAGIAFCPTVRERSVSGSERRGREEEEEEEEE